MHSSTTYSKEVWSGHITVDARDGLKKIEDIRLHASEGANNLDIGPNTSFRFLSIINPAEVPLHFVTGPCLDVYTETASTEEWFNENLLGPDSAHSDEGGSDGFGWTRACRQSSVGVLLDVWGGSKVSYNGRKVTELLIYAALPRDAQLGYAGILTPPRSSSPSIVSDTVHIQRHEVVQTARLYAIPLSFCSFSNESDPEGLLTHSADGSIHGQCQFLLDPDWEREVDLPTHRKHQRLESMFEDTRKKRKRRGNESVVITMANCTSKHNETHVVGFDIGKASKGRSKKLGISRTQSLSSLRDFDQPRPSSKGSAAALGRSSLHHLAGASVYGSSSPAPEAVNCVEQQNKASLARVVMAGMRMYGLHQKKQPSNARAASEIRTEIAGTTIGSLNGNGDEYKLVYHQTYKAAMFAFRQTISVASISQDSLRDVVDKLLEIFCVDPSPRLQGSHVADNPFGSNHHLGAGLFDISNGVQHQRIPVTLSITPRKILTRKAS